jgi:beta-glucosidase
VAVPQAKDALDWIGLQYYQEFRAGFDLAAPRSLFITQRKPRNMPVGPHTWGGLNPGALYDHIQRLWAVLQKPIYITEAGVPDPEDTIRPGYLAETVHAIWKALSYNVPVRGLFFWSLLDNFEWAEGYDPRYSFGLYKTDFQTQERTARDSAQLYNQIGLQNGLSAEAIERYAPALLSKLFPGEPGQNDVKLKPSKTIGG